MQRGADKRSWAGCGRIGPVDASDLIDMSTAAALLAKLRGDPSPRSHAHTTRLAEQGRLKAQRLGRQWFTTTGAVLEYFGARQKAGRKRKPLKLNDLPAK